MNGDKVFTDTNIVVCAYDSAAGRKHQIAATAMKDLWHSGLGLLSNQVLQEFFVTVTKKIASPLETGLAKRIIKNISKWDVVINDVDSILEAIDIQERYKFSFWDCMIIASALKGGATTILSEDLADGMKIESLWIKNPFTSG